MKPNLDYHDFFDDQTGQEPGIYLPNMMFWLATDLCFSSGITVWQIENFVPITVDDGMFAVIISLFICK